MVLGFKKLNNLIFKELTTYLSLEKRGEVPRFDVFFSHSRHPGRNLRKEQE
jgi:hypothetical protein